MRLRKSFKKVAQEFYCACFVAGSLPFSRLLPDGMSRFWGQGEQKISRSSWRDIEKKSFGLRCRSCSISYPEVAGRVVLIRETVAEGTQFQSKLHSWISSFQSARSSWPNYHSAIPNTFPTATVLFLVILPFSIQTGLNAMAATLLHENNKRKIITKLRRKLQAPQWGPCKQKDCRYSKGKFGLWWRRVFRFF